MKEKERPKSALKKNIVITSTLVVVLLVLVFFIFEIVYVGLGTMNSNSRTVHFIASLFPLVWIVLVILATLIAIAIIVLWINFLKNKMKRDKK
ncbi:MAG: hypothetical protein LBG88_02520 [Christensenellaceae bacterium]|jgi:magnesium-transporting ATPase (P-type)|nr:hypothetical protein [Christensenellaceae bacterium]